MKSSMNLLKKHPETDPEKILFVDLRKLVIDLDGFADDPDRSNEKILEAIQATWIDEKD